MSAVGPSVETVGGDDVVAAGPGQPVNPARTVNGTAPWIPGVAIGAAVAVSRLNGRSAPDEAHSRADRGRLWLAVGTAVAGAAMLALPARNAWRVITSRPGDPDDNPIAMLFGYAVLPSLAVLAALAVAVVVARRAAFGWLGAAGALLLAANAAEVLNAAIMWVPHYESPLSVQTLTLNGALQETATCKPSSTTSATRPTARPGGPANGTACNPAHVPHTAIGHDRGHRRTRTGARHRPVRH